LLDDPDIGRKNAVRSMDLLKDHLHPHRKPDVPRTNEIHRNGLAIHDNQTLSSFPVIGFDDASDNPIQNHSPCISFTACAQCIGQ